MKERKDRIENRGDLCGPMALMIAYRAQGHDRTIEDLIDELDVQDGGVNWFQMFNHAINEGFSVTFKNNARYSELIKARFEGIPIVGTTEWDNQVRKRVSHLAVVNSINQASIELIDPDFNNLTYTKIRKLPRDKFIERWHDDETKAALMVIGERLNRPKR